MMEAMVDWAMLFPPAAGNRRVRSARRNLGPLAHLPGRHGLPGAVAGRPSRALLVQAGVFGSVLVLYHTLASLCHGIGPVAQDLTALPVALALSLALPLLDPPVAAPAQVPAATIVDAPSARELSIRPVLTPSVVEEPAPDPAPALATVKAFDDAVRRALTHLADPTRLAASPLLQLTLVDAGLQAQGLEDTRLQRATVLRALLIDLLAGLQPRQRESGRTGAAWRYYNCLYYPYVRGISRRRAPTLLRALRERREREGGPRGELERVVAWLLSVDEDTYYKWQRRGSDSIGLALRERESAAGGSVPVHSARTVDGPQRREASRDAEGALKGGTPVAPQPARTPT